MKTPLILVSTVAAALVVVVAFQARNDAALRRELEAARAASAAEQASLGRKVSRLSEQNEIFKAESEALRKHAAAAPARAPAEPKAEAPGADTTAAGGGAGEGMKGMFADPGMKKLIRQQQGMAVQMMYG